MLRLDLSTKALLTVFLLLGVAGFICVYFFNFNGPPIRGDGEGYYSYLINAFIYHDMTSIRFVTEHLNNRAELIWAYGLALYPDTEYYLCRYPMGVSLMLFPFFCVAALLSQIMGEVQNGYNVYYQYSVSFAGVSYSVLGLFFLAKWLRGYVDTHSTNISLIAVFLGTNLFHYTTYDSILSHAYSFCAITCFLYVLDRWNNAPTPTKSIKLGALLGLITLIRVPNGFFLALTIIFYGVRNMTTFKERISLLLSQRICFYLICLSSLVVFSFQCIYWYKITGQSFVMNSYIEDMGFDWSQHHFDTVLFLPTKGLFFWAPILLLGVVGLGIDWLKSVSISVPAFLILILESTMLAHWWMPELGSGYGHRGFVDFMAFFAFGLALFFKTFRENRIYYNGALVFLVLCVVVNLQRTWHYWSGTLGFGGVTWEFYLSTLFKL